MLRFLFLLSFAFLLVQGRTVISKVDEDEPLDIHVSDASENSGKDNPKRATQVNEDLDNEATVTDRNDQNEPESTRPIMPVAQHSSVSGPMYPGSTYPGLTYPGPMYPGSTYSGSTYPGSTYPGSVYPVPASPLPASPEGASPNIAHPVHAIAVPGYPAPAYPVPAYPVPRYPGAIYPGPTYPAPIYPASRPHMYVPGYGNLPICNPSNPNDEYYDPYRFCAMP